MYDVIFARVSDLYYLFTLFYKKVTRGETRKQRKEKKINQIKIVEHKIQIIYYHFLTALITTALIKGTLDSWSGNNGNLKYERVYLT